VCATKFQLQLALLLAAKFRLSTLILIGFGTTLTKAGVMNYQMHFDPYLAIFPHQFATTSIVWYNFNMIGHVHTTGRVCNASIAIKVQEPVRRNRPIAGSLQFTFRIPDLHLAQIPSSVMSGAEFALIIGAIAASGDVFGQVRAILDTVGNLCTIEMHTSALQAAK
jgi:hypothetical protein